MVPLLRRPATFWSIATVVTVVKLTLVWSGWPESRHIVDDAYYYFTIARHLADGLGPTFDTLAPTNGFHPLWQLLLWPVFDAFGSDLWTPVRAALTLTAILDLATAAAVRSLVTRASGAAIGGASAIVWLVGPFTFLLGLQGMESSLAALGVALTAIAASRYRTSADGPDFKWFVILGAALGACGWARTDQLVTVGLALVVVVAADGRLSWPARARGVALLAGTSAAVMAPWFWWTWTRFGSFVQVSGQVKFFTNRIFGALPSAWDSPGHVLDTVGHAFFAPVLRPARGLAAERFSDAHFYPLLASVLVLGGGFVVATAVSSAWREASRRAELWFPLTFALGHALLFGLVWRAYASWYALPWLTMLLCALGIAAPALVARNRILRRATLGAAVLVAAMSLAVYPVYALRIPHEAKGPELLWRPVLDEVMTLLPQGGVAGAWDAGAVGYVATEYPQLKVVNLDCLVNNVAFDAVRDGTYRQYLLSTVDVFLQDRRRARMFLEPDELQRFVQP